MPAESPRSKNWNCFYLCPNPLYFLSPCASLNMVIVRDEIYSKISQHMESSLSKHILIWKSRRWFPTIQHFLTYIPTSLCQRKWSLTHLFKNWARSLCSLDLLLLTTFYGIKIDFSSGKLTSEQQIFQYKIIR